MDARFEVEVPSVWQFEERFKNVSRVEHGGELSTLELNQNPYGIAVSTCKE